MAIMGVKFRQMILAGAVILVTNGFSTSVQAQEVQIRPAQLGTPSIPEAIDQTIDLEDYFREQSTLGDLRFTFGLDYQEADINRAAKRLEALYRDLLQQQADDSPILRTRDLASPYTTSLLSEAEAEPEAIIFESIAP